MSGKDIQHFADNQRVSFQVISVERSGAGIVVIAKDLVSLRNLTNNIYDYEEDTGHFCIGLYDLHQCQG